LKTIRKTLEDIDNWWIAVQGLDPRYQVLDLEILYDHGWSMQIDTLRVEFLLPPKRSLWRRVLGSPEPCVPVLYIHAKAYNECGSPLIDSTASLIIVENQKSYPLKVRKVSDGHSGKGQEYEWWSEPILNDPYLASKLGEVVEVRLLLPGNRHIFQNSTLLVPVCAKYIQE
jgi:hypothetical protein